ncbi:uncharacterized protein LOC126739326 isoform X2 [Anthonomus grandis grandis]|uniref:uncharacterized protein LOC126739326 isoform X2 n=1 Tax=Anthonomus grandis grandis TaxID=2921223 RepID=UPI00216662FB|nr:uncharacterized protein LOC126739326 isoform X2 [Anthonomus grandis grandis]
MLTKEEYPVEPYLSSIFSIRFNFGVPLEDILPPNDIHPRLKILFQKTFMACISHGFDIEHILRYDQGTLKEKLQLKDKLISSLDYRITENYTPGSYFWVLRHFFGLLPVPVCPKYTKGAKFEWASLAEECKYLLKNHDKNKKGLLDYDIAQNINMLPIENGNMLSIMVKFLRKLSVKKTTFKEKQKYDRMTLKLICEYFSPCMFDRPFRPGGSQRCEYKPLLLYLILRWDCISQYCHNIRQSTHILNEEFINYLKLPNMTNMNLGFQLADAFFKPETIRIYKNIPFLINACNKYLRDSGCQTECDLNGNIAENCKRKDEDNTKNNAKKNEQIGSCENDMFETATEFVFTSNLVLEKNESWSQVITSTQAMVKRIEESFIYDDYDTLKVNDFNQVAKCRSSIFREYWPKIRNSKLRILSKKRILQSSTPKRKPSDIENSYVKFQDIFVSDHDANECSLEKYLDMDELKIVANQNNISEAQNVFDDNSSSISQRSLQDKVKTKKSYQYVLNRLRASLKYLRNNTPKNNPLKMGESKIKYRRMKNAFG